MIYDRLVISKDNIVTQYNKGPNSSKICKLFAYIE